MASRDALPPHTSGRAFADRSDPAPLGDPAYTASGLGISDRHVFVDGCESSSAAASLQSASTFFQNHRTQVLASPSFHPSRALVMPLGADRRDDSATAIHGDR